MSPAVVTVHWCNRRSRPDRGYVAFRRRSCIPSHLQPSDEGLKEEDTETREKSHPGLDLREGGQRNVGGRQSVPNSPLVSRRQMEETDAGNKDPDGDDTGHVCFCSEPLTERC